VHARLKFVVTLVAICAVPLALHGCLLYGIALTVSPNGGVVYASESSYTDTCPADFPPAGGNGTLTCTYTVKTVDGMEVATSVSLFDHGDDSDGSDPIVLQVPAAVSGFTGTFDNGAGVSGALSIHSGLRAVPADYYTDIVAEPGMQLVMIDFPSSTPLITGNFNFTFGYSAGGDAVKVMSTARVRAAGQTFYPPMYPCEIDFTNVPALATPPDPEFFAQALAGVVKQIKPCARKAYKFPLEVDPADSVEVVEYYHPVLDHYFMTWVPDEIAILDAGVKIKGWRRTGQVFRAFGPSRAGTSPVCRFYLPPPFGDSHFYGRGAAECAATAQKNPGFELEDAQFMNLLLPVDGFCPPKTTEIYRVFSNRADANHRYLTDRDLRDEMVTRGWLAEGDGKEQVVMCAVRAW